LKKLYVKEIRERDLVDATFLVREKIIGMAKNGRPYMTLKLMDRSGEVEGRIWDRVDEFSARFERDDFVRVAGKASVYMGKMQLIIQELDPVDEAAVDIADFLPVSARPLNEMATELAEIVERMTDPALRGLMRAFLDDAEFMQGYTRAPAAKSMHHVYLGGLLEHSLAVAALAGDIAGRYPGINRDLLVVGALLHDVGKVAELRYRRAFEYTDAGKLLGHIAIGVELVEEKLRGQHDFPQELALHLKHLLLSHHGQYAYGSPKRPKTLEAVVLNFIDDLDSKINGVRTHIEREPDSVSSWTRYHRLYDRYFFKGSKRSEEAASQAQALEQKESGRRESRPPAQRFSNTLADQLRVKARGVLGDVDKKGSS
jgi:3'-5' exoribonuclease